MPISQNKYVNITSGQGGNAAASRKDLILRLFTENSLFPTGNVIEFSNSMAVSDFAGADSKEAKIAAAYFSWISKQSNKAKKISVMRYAKEDSKPYLRSTYKLPSLEEFKKVSNGQMTLSMGGVNYDLQNLSFTEASSYADVATKLQEAIVKNADAGELWTSATVAFDEEMSSFVLTGGEAGDNVITYALPKEKDTTADLVGWTVGKNAIASNGVEAQSIADVLNESVQISNNFASFAFVDELTTEDLDAIGAFCDEQNNEYMFVFDVNSSNYNDMIGVAAKHSGMCANYSDTVGDLPAYLMPATILAATDYDKINGTVNYMYQQFDNQSVSVDSDDLAGKLDGLKINYNGQTQKSGTKLEFYQDGYLADGTDIGVFANEIWLKDAMKTSILNLFVALDKVSANTDGISLLEGALQAIALEAKNNGTISAEKDLTNEQKAYITQYTGDENAWQTVYLNGYIVSVELKQEVADGRTKYIAEYSLLYSKGDSIRKVEGVHTLI